MSYPYGLGIVHNGNIFNVEELKHDLRTRSRRHLLTHSDTEIVLNLFAEGMAEASNTDSSNPGSGDAMFENICRSVQEVYRRVNGSYSIITLVADHGLVAFRDPHGIRPLVWGKRKVRRDNEISGALESGEAHCLASESVALGFLGYELVRSIEPGEVIFIDMKGKVHTRVLDMRGRRHCMFEWVYFASPESEIDGVPVYGSRIQLGKSLARQLKRQIQDRQIEADIIVPIPETSRIAAIALAEELAIPYREVLIKNRYIKRTFILDSQEKRQKAVNLKLSPVRSEIEGKRVILVDDSIVRGTTSKKIIELVRQAGAAKVYFVSTCPPIQHPCYYGIDFPEQSELIAANRSLAEIEQEMGADAVIYQDVEGLKQSLVEAQSKGTSACSSSGASASKSQAMNPCTACLDGKYPTDVSASAKCFAAARKADRGGKTQ
jgi:amidophosphoribosyltransferase